MKREGEQSRLTSLPTRLGPYGGSARVEKPSTKSAGLSDGGENPPRLTGAFLLPGMVEYWSVCDSIGKKEISICQ
jgi:hypothetical protein